jgi:hypothetical protein
MNKTSKATLLNIMLPGVGYLYYKVDRRAIIGWFLAALTFIELALFLYVPIAYDPGRYTFHWSPLFDPGRWVLRIVLALDTYFLLSPRFRTVKRNSKVN